MSVIEYIYDMNPKRALIACTAVCAVLVADIGSALSQERFFAFPGRFGADGAREAAQLQQETNRGISHQISITAIEGNVTTLENRMTTTEGNVTGLQGRMTTAEVNLSSLQSDVTSLTSTITSMPDHAKAIMPGTCSQSGAKLRWNTTSNNWECVAEGDPTVRDFAKNDLPTCASNQLLRSNASGFTCVQAGSDYVAAEVDPKIGATTSNLFCRGTGSQVTCDQPVPSLTETDPQVGAVTSGKACRGDGSSIQCDQDVVAKGGDAMTGNLSVPAPTSGAHAATKSYVDAAVVAAGGGGASPFCYYTYNGNCGTGWTEMPGNYYNSNTVHKICCSGGQASSFQDALPAGYAVRTGSTYNGNLGGLAGADAACLTELQNTPWNGKSDATERGLLTSGKVEAFLCGSTPSSCRTFKAYTRYYASVTRTLAGSPDYSEVGGTNVQSLTKNFNGYLHLVGTNLNTSNGASTTFWVGGLQSGGISNCNNWTIGTNSNDGYFGYSQGSGANSPVLNTDQYSSCNSQRSLVCLVHP